LEKLFGTDGIRGVANMYPMTTELAMQVGRGVAYVFKNKHRRPKILIGKDTRLSGYMLENAIAAGICSMGVDVMLVGPLPTPAIAFLTQSMRADAGIVISASHNPFQDNGIKVFGNDGFKLPDETEGIIEELIFSDRIDSLRPTATAVGKAVRIDDARGRYIVFLKATFPKDMMLDGIKLVIDCAHGATYRVAPSVFEELGAEVVLFGVSPDGENINQNCGSTHPELISRAVKEEKADAGLAFDGDGDRLIMVDEKGSIVDGDRIMAMCAQDLIIGKKLKKHTVVGTLMSNMGMEVALNRLGARLIRTSVGDRYVVEEMRKKGYNLGGEQSGHIIFLDYNTTGDGILSALQVLAIVKKTGKGLSELAGVMETYPQKLINVKVKEKKDLSSIPAIKQCMDDTHCQLGDAGRLLVRYSGTESLARVMVEAEDARTVNEMAEQVAAVIREHLGA
jgi:phosphoglucosamine mutase